MSPLDLAGLGRQTQRFRRYPEQLRRTAQIKPRLDPVYTNTAMVDAYRGAGRPALARHASHPGASHTSPCSVAHA